MSGQTRWSRASSEMGHPDDTILLAYTRQQNLGEDWERISQHMAYCKRCLLRCNELMHISELLAETLVDFQSSQYYPSLVGGVLESIQSPAAARLVRQKRQRARLLRQSPAGVNSRVLLALSSIPFFSIAALIALLLLAVAIAFAFSISTFGVQVPFQSSSRSVPAVTEPKLTVPAHSTAIGTARPASSPALNGSPTVTATVTPGLSKSQPAIKLCTTKLDGYLARIRLCGSNFTPGDKLELIAHTAGSNSRARHVTVDAQGTFQDIWTLNTCNNYPIAISVIDLTHTSEVVPELQNVQLGQCFPVPFSIGVVWPNKH